MQRKLINRAMQIISVVLVFIISSATFARAIEYVGYEDEESGYSFFIDDMADLFTDEEAEEMLNILYEISEYGYAGVVTIDENPFGNTEAYANQYLLDYYGDGISAVILVLDMDNRLITIWSDGYLERTVSPKSTTITDNIYKLASKGEYGECAIDGLAQINAVVNGQKIAQPMKYMSNAGLAIILSLVISYFVARITSSTSKANDNETRNAIFSQFKLNNPKAIFSHQTKEYSPQSSDSSSGGGGGGGGGGSGGSHGF